MWTVNTYIHFMFFNQKILYFTYFFITFFVCNPMEWQHTTHEYNTFQQIQIHVWSYISILVLFNFKMLLIIFLSILTDHGDQRNPAKYIDEEGNYYMAKGDKLLAFLKGCHDLIPEKHVAMECLLSMVSLNSYIQFYVFNWLTFSIEWFFFFFLFFIGALKQTKTYVNYVRNYIVIQ